MDNELIVRPLITQNKRIILWNVPPIIPHYVITDALDKHDNKPESAITFLRVSSKQKEHSHIMNFRRQVYLTPEDTNKLPPIIKITFDDTIYNIFASSDSLTCFVCQKVGHLAKDCPQPFTLTPKPQLHLPNEFPTLQTSTIEDSPIELTRPVEIKRPLSNTGSQSSLPTSKPLINAEFNLPHKEKQQKKPKKDTSTPTQP